MSARSDLLKKNDLIGKFVVEKVLGAGSFGVTYLARDTTLDRKVAIKEFFPEQFASRSRTGTIVAINSDKAGLFDWAKSRFISEAQILAKFGESSNIVTVHDVINERNTSYIVMAFINGQTLEDWTLSYFDKGHRPDKADVLEIIDQLLDGCERLHQEGIIHRDIKPLNIMLTIQVKPDRSGGDRATTSEQRSNVVPILIDFGNSRDLSLQHGGHTAVVTDFYSPPEQYSSKNRSEASSDIYALACTFYFILTGTPPPVSIARLADPIQPIPAPMVELYGRKLVDGIMAGMALNREHRPQSIAEWREQLGRDDPNSAPALPPKGLNRRMVLAGASGAALLGVGSIGGWMLYNRSPLSSFAHPMNNAWDKNLGRIFAETYPRVQVLANGDALFASTLIDEAEQLRAQISRVNASGAVVGTWRDDTASGVARSILPTSDGGVLVGGGTSQGQATIVRLGADLREKWRKSVGDGVVTAVLANRDGFALGIEGPDLAGAELAVVDPSGSQLRRTAIDIGKAETVQRMIALKDGSFAVLGWGVQQQDDRNGNYAFLSILRSDGQRRNRTDINGLGAANVWALEEADNVIYVAGSTSDGRQGSPSHLLVCAFDSNAVALWQRWDYPVTPAGAYALAADPAGLLYVGGWQGSPQKLHLTQIGPKGDIVWEFASPRADAMSSIMDMTLGSDGSLHIAASVKPQDKDFNLLATRMT